MPTCDSTIHRGSGLPVVLPPDAFYRRRDTGTLYRGCRHCRCVVERLRRTVGLRPPWPRSVRAAAWAAYWAAYWRRHDHTQHRRDAPPGQAWCTQGHYAPTTALCGQRNRWCNNCLAVADIRRKARRKGQSLSWEQAVACWQQRSQHATRWRNRLAPPGERWCSLCQRYFLVPAHWHRWQKCPCQCPACRNAVLAALRQRPAVAD